MLSKYLTKSPVVDPAAWVAPDARVIGDVTIGEHSSVWYQCVLRGDVSHIRIGKRSNIQDHSTLHVSRDHGPTIVGDDVTVGHRAVVHGCEIGNRALIGIGAIVLDHAVIEPGAMVAAMSLVTSGTVVPAGMVVMGQPAKVVRAVSPEERAWMDETLEEYMTLAREHAGSA
ncbi:MAG: gamma carbonic anhydrase family protein [Deltaproteobacteria bacterium]